MDLEDEKLSSYLFFENDEIEKKKKNVYVNKYSGKWKSFVLGQFRLYFCFKTLSMYIQVRQKTVKGGFTFTIFSFNDYYLTFDADKKDAKIRIPF